jgi:hypothetical protein
MKLRKQIFNCRFTAEPLGLNKLHLTYIYPLEKAAKSMIISKKATICATAAVKFRTRRASSNM